MRWTNSLTPEKKSAIILDVKKFTDKYTDLGKKKDRSDFIELMIWKYESGGIPQFVGSILDSTGIKFIL